MMQQLWKANIGWDESVPQEIHISWMKFRDELHLLNNFSTSRKLIIDNAKEIQIHGFCDASETAYGACIFFRSTDRYNRHQVGLLCAKSRVAPVKTGYWLVCIKK